MLKLVQSLCTCDSHETAAANWWPQWSLAVPLTSPLRKLIYHRKPLLYEIDHKGQLMAVGPANILSTKPTGGDETNQTITLQSYNLIVNFYSRT